LSRQRAAELDSRGLAQEVTLMVNGVRGSVRRDAVAVEFDDERLVANAGLLLTATLSARRGLERLVDQTRVLGQRARAARPGRKRRDLALGLAQGVGRRGTGRAVLRAGAAEAAAPRQRERRDNRPRRLGLLEHAAARLPYRVVLQILDQPADAQAGRRGDRDD